MLHHPGSRTCCPSDLLHPRRFAVVSPRNGRRCDRLHCPTGTRVVRGGGRCATRSGKEASPASQASRAAPTGKRGRDDLAPRSPWLSAGFIQVTPPSTYPGATEAQERPHGMQRRHIRGESSAWDGCMESLSSCWRSSVPLIPRPSLPVTLVTLVTLLYGHWRRADEDSPCIMNVGEVDTHFAEDATGAGRP